MNNYLLKYPYYRHTLKIIAPEITLNWIKYIQMIVYKDAKFGDW